MNKIKDFFIKNTCCDLFVGLKILFSYELLILIDKKTKICYVNICI